MILIDGSMRREQNNNQPLKTQHHVRKLMLKKSDGLDRPNQSPDTSSQATNVRITQHINHFDWIP